LLDPEMADFINGLTYPDKDFFTIKETCFMLQFWGSFGEDHTKEQVEADRKALCREAGARTEYAKASCEDPSQGDRLLEVAV